MLQLDPAYPVLWRSPTVLQFGLDAVVVIDDPAPWQERLLRELEQGIAEAAWEPTALALGAPRGAAREFVGLIAPALMRPPSARRRIILQVSDPFPAAQSDAVAAGLRSTGLDVEQRTWFGAQTPSAHHVDATVVLAHHLIEPRRVAALMAQDMPHVPIVFTGGAADVGPLVVPGQTACLACIAEYRRDDDPTWPHVAAQLIGRSLPEVATSLGLEAGITAARLLSDVARHPAKPPSIAARTSHSVRIREQCLHRCLSVHRPHAECRCRSLAETSTVVVHAFPATMTPTAFALPA